MELELPVSTLKLDGSEKNEDGEDKEEEEQVALMYFRAFRPPHGSVWYIITPDAPTGSVLNPMFLKNKHHHDRTACTVVGSKIYVLGGEEDPYLRDDARERGYKSVTKLAKVYYADANNRKEGWTEAEETLKQPRAEPYAVTIGEKIYLFGGRWEAEVYDTLDESKSKLLLSKIPPEMEDIQSHAVLDDGNRVLLLDQCGTIYSYHVQDDKYQVYSNGVFENYYLQALAVLDGTLYAVGVNLPGLIMSLDLTNPKATPKQVLGLDDIPKIPGPNHTSLKRLFLVPLGTKKRMALVWSHRKRPVMTVYCVSMDMHKDDESGSIVAKFVNRSKYRVNCAFLLLDFLPIFVDPNLEKKKTGSKDETGQEEMNKGNDDESAKEEKEKNASGDSAAQEEKQI